MPDFSPYYSIDQGLRHLAKRLNPIIAKTLAPHLGGLEWTVILSELDRAKGRQVRNYSPGDLQSQLRIFTEHLGGLGYPFNDKHRTVTTLGSELRILRNRWAHGDELDTLDAMRGQDFCVRLLEHFKDEEGLTHARELHNEALEALARERGYGGTRPSTEETSAQQEKVSAQQEEASAPQEQASVGQEEASAQQEYASAQKQQAQVRVPQTQESSEDLSGNQHTGQTHPPHTQAESAAIPTVSSENQEHPAQAQPTPKTATAEEKVTAQAPMEEDEAVTPDSAVYTRLHGAETPTIGAGRYEYEPWETIIVGESDILDALPKKVAKEKVRALAAEIAEYEGPIHLGRLTRLVALGFDMQRLVDKRRKRLERQVRQCGLTVDKAGYVWPSDIDPNTWDEFRPNSSDAAREFTEITPIEIANAYNFFRVTQPELVGAELDAAVLRTFGRKRRTATVVAHLKTAMKLAAKRAHTLTPQNADRQEETVQESGVIGEPSGRAGSAGGGHHLSPRTVSKSTTASARQTVPVPKPAPARKTGGLNQANAESTADAHASSTASSPDAQDYMTARGSVRSASENVTEMLYFTDYDSDARGRIVEGKFILLAGSRLRPEESFAPKYREKGMRLRQEFSQFISSDNVVLKDLEFSSPSTAGKFVTGSSVNGREYWRNAAGIPLKILQGSESSTADATEAKSQAETTVGSGSPTSMTVRNSDSQHARAAGNTSVLTAPTDGNVAGESSADDGGHVYRMTHAGLVAYGRKSETGGFLLLTGSQVRPLAEFPAKTMQRFIDARAQHADSLSTDNIVTEDILFRSPSGAASFVAGTSLNGPLVWKEN